MHKILVCLLASFVCHPSTAQQVTDAYAPEIKSALNQKTDGTPVTSQNWMVSAANPLAAQAGAKILDAGGTAADAMIAVQAVLGLVEPQSSGLGGGAFLVWYDGETKEITTLDGRETAPLTATPRLFQDAQGEPLKFFEAVVGGLSVGTPGTPALMDVAHRKWGRANWPSLFEDAIALAKDGFEVSPRLAFMVEGDKDRLSRFARTAAYFLPNGEPISAGARLTNLAYANTLQAFAHHGAKPFYEGSIAQDIVATTRHAQGNPGQLSLDDLALYKVVQREPVCTTYRAHDVCGMGPPSSGALTVGQILGMLEGFDLSSGPQGVENWRLIGDASRLAFADRGRYMADSDFVPVPVKGLIDPEYLSLRATLLTSQSALSDVAPGFPAFDHAALHWADDESIERPSTSHISIVDQYGNALSMTTTIENAFGSRLMTEGGFLLNNELTDFSFRTHVDGIPIANRVEPGKRPRSSMAPTIVLKDGRPVLVLGSPGGSRIIGYVAKTIIAHLDWGLNIQEAINLPHLVNRFGTYDVEGGTDAEALVSPLTDLGFEAKPRALTSGLHAIAITNTGLNGGADPRREGVAIGK